MKKYALALISTITLVFGFGASAQAQPYESGEKEVTVVPGSTTPGGPITVAVTGCTDGEILTFTIGSSSATATCVNGQASVQLTAPTGVGSHNGSVTGTMGFAGIFVVGVLAGGGLPATGSSGISTTTSVALGLVAVGLGLVVVAQLRRRHAALS